MELPLVDRKVAVGKKLQEGGTTVSVIVVAVVLMVAEPSVSCTVESFDPLMFKCSMSICCRRIRHLEQQ